MNTIYSVRQCKAGRRYNGMYRVVATYTSGETVITYEHCSIFYSEDSARAYIDSLPAKLFQDIRSGWFKIPG